MAVELKSCTAIGDIVQDFNSNDGNRIISLLVPISFPRFAKIGAATGCEPRKVGTSAEGLIRLRLPGKRTRNLPILTVPARQNRAFRRNNSARETLRGGISI